MREKIFISLFAISLVFILSSARTDDKENPFRMKKLNMIWQQAQNKMSERKLNDFRRLLELQDRAEIRWKELKASGGDEDGEMEAELRRKFTRLLEQFGLDKHGIGENNEIKDNTAGRGIYADKRLDELWESVRKQGTCLGEISAQPQTLIMCTFVDSFVTAGSARKLKPFLLRTNSPPFSYTKQ